MHNVTLIPQIKMLNANLVHSKASTALKSFCRGFSVKLLLTLRATLLISMKDGSNIEKKALKSLSLIHFSKNCTYLDTVLLKGFLSVFFLSVCTLDTHRLSHYSKLDFLLRIYSVSAARNKIPNRNEISAMSQ